MSDLKDGLDAIEAAGLGHDRAQAAQAECIGYVPPIGTDSRVCVVVPTSDLGGQAAGFALFPQYNWRRAEEIDGVGIAEGAQIALLCEAGARATIAKKIGGTSRARIVSNTDRLTELETATGSESGAGVSVVGLLRERGAQRTREAIRAIVEPQSAENNVRLATDWVTRPYAELERLAEAMPALPFVDVDEYREEPPALLSLRVDGTMKTMARAGGIVLLTAKQKVGKSAVASAVACSILATTEAGADGHSGDASLGFTSPCVGCLYIDTERGGYSMYSYWSKDSPKGAFRHRLPHVEPTERARRVRVVDASRLDRNPLHLLALLQQAERLGVELGGRVLVVIDKLDSFIPNAVLGGVEGERAAELVQKWALGSGNVVLIVQHDNRAGGERGHIGTQLVDKAEAHLRLTATGAGTVALNVAASRYEAIDPNRAIPLIFDENGLLQREGDASVLVSTSDPRIERLRAQHPQGFTKAEAAKVYGVELRGMERYLNAQGSLRQHVDLKGKGYVWKTHPPTDD